MRSRTPLILSLGLNAVLAALAVAQWTRPAPASRQPAPLRAQQPAGEPAVRAPAAPTNAPPRLTFHWAQVESDDYRQYVANLRAIGCPERLIRDLIVRDVEELYEHREAALPAPSQPPWANRDSRRKTGAQNAAQRAELVDERRAVLQELLGFAWEGEAIRLCRNEPFVWILLGFLPDELAMKALSLPNRYEQASERIREQADNILLPADRAALNALADQFEAELATLIGPSQVEELELRLQALSVLNDFHLDDLDLTAQQARELARLSRLVKDPIREDFIRATAVSADEEAQRKQAFNREVAMALSPSQYAEFERVQDDRYREALNFSQQRKLPRPTAIKAFEVRQAAEDEARRIREAKGVEAATRQAQLEELQQATATALTTLLGPQNMTEYLKQPGAWLNDIGKPPVQP